MRSLAFDIVEQDRFSEAGRLAQFDITGNDGVVHLVTEKRNGFLDHLAREIEPAVEHREQDTFYMQVGVECRLHQLDRPQQLTQPLECVVLALHRNQYRIGCGQGVDRKQTQARRAIDQDVVVLVADPLERLLQSELSRYLRYQFHFGAGKITVGGQKIQKRNLCFYYSVINQG